MSNKELRELCVKVVKRGKTNAEEKMIIAAECDARGIKLNTKCANCYIDAASIIYTQLPEDNEQAGNDGSKWVLRHGVDVTFGGVRVCEATITDELAERIVARGFSKRMFAKYPQQ